MGFSRGPSRRLWVSVVGGPRRSVTTVGLWGRRVGREVGSVLSGKGTGSTLGRSGPLTRPKDPKPPVPSLRPKVVTGRDRIEGRTSLPSFLHVSPKSFDVLFIFPS